MAKITSTINLIISNIQVHTLPPHILLTFSIFLKTEGMEGEDSEVRYGVNKGGMERLRLGEGTTNKGLSFIASPNLDITTVE